MKPAPRYPLDYPVKVVPLRTPRAHRLRTAAQGRGFSGVSCNLSRTGLALQISDPSKHFEPGQKLALRLMFGDPKQLEQSVVLEGRVVWADEKGMYGVQIVEADVPSTALYESLLEGFEALLNFAPLREVI